MQSMRGRDIGTGDTAMKTAVAVSNDGDEYTPLAGSLFEPMAPRPLYNHAG